jgi:hypothetical protein
MSTLTSQSGSSPADSKERIAGEELARPDVDLEQIGEKEGYVLDEEHLRKTLNIPDSAIIKTAADGKTVLIPQPSEDPQDPLNWPAWKKTVILYIVSLTAFTGDYGSAIGGITLLPQAQYAISLLPIIPFPEMSSDSYMQGMAYDTRCYQSRYRWQRLHVGSRRYHRCLVFCVFWTTSSAHVLPIDEPSYVCMEWLSHQLRVVHDGQNPAWLLRDGRCCRK